MKSFYISFGQIHTHRYGGQTLDCDCIGVLMAPDEASARRFCQTKFDNKYCTTYSELPEMEWFNRGLVYLGVIPAKYIKTTELAIKEAQEKMD